MLSAGHSAVLDKVWNGFRPATELKPLAVLDFIHSLLFLKQLDEIQAEKGRISALSGAPIDSPIYMPNQQDLRWSSFQYLDKDTLFELFYREGGVLDFVKNVPEYTRLRKFNREDKPLIPPRYLLEEMVTLINQLSVPEDSIRMEMIDYLEHKSRIDKASAHSEVPLVVEEVKRGATKPKITVQKSPEAIKPTVAVQDTPQIVEARKPAPASGKRKFSLSFVKTFVFLLLAAFVVALIYFVWGKEPDKSSRINSAELSKVTRDNPVGTSAPAGQEANKDSIAIKKPAKITSKASTPKDTVVLDKTKKSPVASSEPEQEVAISAIPNPEPIKLAEENKTNENRTASNIKARYKIRGKAYFHDQPDESTRRNAFVLHWNNSYATLEALDEKDGFIYVVFRNHQNQTSKGWLRKKDLRPID